MIAGLRRLLRWQRKSVPAPTRADAELRGLAVEALDRWVRALRANPQQIGGADAAAIVREVYVRESLTEAEFFVMADHFDAAVAHLMDSHWAEHLRTATPAGRA